MKKFSFLIYHKEYDTFLKELQELGLIHVVENKENQENNKSLETFYAQHKQFSESEKTLRKWIDKKTVLAENAEVETGLAIPQQIEDIQEAKAELLQKLQIVKKEKDSLSPWGDFDLANIAKLQESGYDLNFFVVADNAYNEEWEELHNAVVVAEQSSKTHFVTVTHKGVEVAKELQLDPVKLPEASISQLNKLTEELEAEVATKDEEMKQLATQLPSLLLAKNEMQHNINYEKVMVSANKMADDKVMHLQGWAPAENEKDICNYLEEKNAYYEVADPQPEDDVPIKFKNKKFYSFFEPIAEVYMLPKYNEIDLTPYFAPFYMIFFGLSLGDIGYGLFLFLVGTGVKIFMKKKLELSMKGILSLVQVLGLSAMVTGFLTGGFFGANIYQIDAPFIKTLEENVFLDNNQMFSLSLILGVIQILVGMCFKVANRVKQFGFKYGLSTIGWIVLLVSCIAAYLLGDTMPMFGTLHLVFLIPAAVLIYFFNSPGKNPLMNLGLGLWDTYNMATGLLGDILSYVRLFALGLSGGILASVFNSLAAGMSPDNAILGPIVYLLIFLVGHAITIFMNTLGAIVHPIRLTFVEFYKNAEFEGGGQKYTPFKTGLK